MALLTAANFRSETLDEACQGLPLEIADAEDAIITASIVRLTSRLQRWTNDTFEAVTGTVVVDGYASRRLELPQRYTAVTSVKTYNELGTLSSALAATSYRLHSSLNTAGTERINNNVIDWLELIYGAAGLTTVPLGGDVYLWPAGTRTVEVIGTYGWNTPPPDIKRALALMVWDHIKRKRDDLRDAESVQAGGVLVRYAQPNPAEKIWTGIGEVDEIVNDYSRRITVGVR